MKTQNNNSLEDVIKSSSQQKNIIFNISKTWIAYLVLIIMVIGSILIKGVVQDRMNGELNTEFEKSYSSVISRFNNQYDKLYQVINSTQGLYYQNVEVVRDYFEFNGAVPVMNFNSIMSLNYAPKVMHSYLPEFQWNSLRQGYYSYDLHPNVERDYYYPVLHIVKYELNKERLAFDYASVDVMKNAIELAQSKNILVSTELFDLREDTLSFALIAPIYQQDINFNSAEELKDKFLGSVVMEINAQRYFENAIKGADVSVAQEASDAVYHPTDTTIIFSVVDKDSQGNENIVFKSGNEDLLHTSGFTPLFQTSVNIKIANRELVVNFATVPGFGATQANLPIIVLIVSLILSLLAFILIIVLLTQKARAEEIAERMTASQRRIVEISRDIIAVASAEGIWLSMNPASFTLLGLENSKVIGKNFVDFLYNEKDIKQWQTIQTSNEVAQRVDFRVKSNNDKGFLWINFSFSKPKGEKLIYIIGRDVTVEKEASEEIKFRTKQIELANCYEQESSATKVQLMIQLSHEMRNQLTGMMGYLQLITSKAFDNEEELHDYAELAYDSAANAFTYISDMSEATIGDTDTASKNTLYKLEETVLPAISQYQKNNKSVNLQFHENGKNSHVIVDGNVMKDVWIKIIRILTLNDPNSIINISANENRLEGVTELVIEASAGEDMNRIINIYNTSSQHLIERLREDTDDILLDIAKCASYLSRMMCSFNIESMDNGKSIYIFITLPLVLRIREH